MSVLSTENECWGFWGTMSFAIPHNELPDTWAAAFQAIETATGFEGEPVQKFLDSVLGRHFADGVRDQICRGQSVHEAIDATIDQWQTWRTSCEQERDLGIPSGLPYLTGYVAWNEIELELQSVESV